MAEYIEVTGQFSTTMEKILPTDQVEADFVNGKLQQLLNNEAYLNRHKINLVVTEEEIPVEERVPNTMYFTVKEKQTIGTSDTVRVSPTMGIKVVED